jgi:hypothetical protein
MLLFVIPAEAGILGFRITGQARKDKKLPNIYQGRAMAIFQKKKTLTGMSRTCG